MTPLSLACCFKNFRFARKFLELGVQRKFDIDVLFSSKRIFILCKAVLDWEHFVAECNCEWRPTYCKSYCRAQN